MNMISKNVRAKFLALCLGSAMAALVAGPAAADEASGMLSGGFDTISGAGTSLTAETVGLGVALPVLTSGVKLQFDASYSIGSGGGTSTQIFNWDGMVYYRDPQWQLGGFFDMASANNHGGHVTPYGVVGDYYFNDQFTAGVIGGGFSSSASSGGMIEGHLIGYVLPTLSLKGYDTYLSASGANLNTIGATAEWQISETAPFSLYTGYSNLQISGTGPSTSFDVFSVGLKIYLNGSGPLVNLHRTGNVDLSTLNSALRFAF